MFSFIEDAMVLFRKVFSSSVVTDRSWWFAGRSVNIRYGSIPENRVHPIYRIFKKGAVLLLTFLPRLFRSLALGNFPSYIRKVGYNSASFSV